MNRHLPQEKSFTSVEQLCAYHNECFIRLAYQCILGREVDADGLHHHLQLFHQSIGPAELLIALRNSDEYKMKFSSLNENVKSVSLENQIGIVDKLFSSIAMDRVANFFKTKL